MARFMSFALLVATLAGATACTASQGDAAAAQRASTPASTPAAATPAGAVPAIDGQPYAQARATLVAAGWTPMPSPTCVRDVFGEVPADRCTTQPDAPACTACTDTPELESCSSSGQCLMRFVHSAVPGRLHVTAYGSLAQRHAADGDFIVQRHEQVATAAP